MDGLYDTGVGAFPALNAYFFVQYNAPAVPVRQRAGRAGAYTGPLPVTGEAVCRKEFSGQAAQCAHLDGAFGIGVAFMVHTGADTLAGKAAEAFADVIRLKNFTQNASPYVSGLYP